MGVGGSLAGHDTAPEVDPHRQWTEIPTLQLPTLN